MESILDRLLDAQRDGTSPTMRRRLGQLTSDAASFAGWLAYDLGGPGSARAHFALAANSARDAGDRRLWALALASEGINNSPAVDGSAGDPRRALALLQQAITGVRGQAPAGEGAVSELDEALLGA